MWGISSAGRALAWHARGQRFDPAILHQKSTVLRRKYGAFLFSVRTHPHENSILLQTENRQRISTLTVFLWARVDYASRAAKNSPPGCFCPAGLSTGPQLFESTRLASGKVITKQKLQYPVRILEFLVGAGGFEPPKLKSSRFTVCPHWPLGNTPIFCSRPSPDCLYILSSEGHLSTTFSRIFSFSVVLYFPAFYRNKSTFYNSKRPQNVFRFEVFLELVTGVEPATH